MHTRDQYLRRVGVDVWYSRFTWPTSDVIPRAMLPVAGKEGEEKVPAVLPAENSTQSVEKTAPLTSSPLLVPTLPRQGPPELHQSAGGQPLSDTAIPEESLRLPPQEVSNDFESGLSAGLSLDWFIGTSSSTLFFAQIDETYPVTSQQNLLGSVCAVWQNYLHHDRVEIQHFAWPPLPGNLPFQSDQALLTALASLLHHEGSSPNTEIIFFGERLMGQFDLLKKLSPIKSPNRLPWNADKNAACILPSLSQLLASPELKSVIWPMLLKGGNRVAGA